MDNRLLQFTIICCKIRLTDKDTEILYDYIKVLNIEDIISFTYRHGILPIVYKKLQTLENIPNELISNFKQHYIKIVQKNMIMSAELLKIVKLLEKNNIKTIAFKGPTLSQLAYYDITSRQFNDLDLFINTNEWERASDILKKHGYIDILNLLDQQKQIWNQKAKEINLYNSKNCIYVDLQRYIFDDDYPLKFNYNLFNNTTYVEINKQLIPTFNTEALLIYLTIHGSKHLFERIGWIKDIDMLIRNQQIDWVLVDNKLKTIKDFKRMFLLGIYLSYIYYQTPIPKNYIEMFYTNKWLSSLETFILSNWQYKKNFIYHTYTSLKLFPSISQKVSYISKVVLKPSKNEYRLIQFPNGMYFLYYPLRVFSLIKKYLFSF